jgi:predicted dehydrogenase
MILCPLAVSAEPAPNGRTTLVRDFEQRYPPAYVEELEAFARSAADGVPPRVTARDALAAFDLAQAATLSWRLGRPVPVDPVRTAAAAVKTPGLTTTMDP